MKDVYAELESERSKLLQMIENTHRKGIPLVQSRVILAQSRKVDNLILRAAIRKRK